MYEEEHIGDGIKQCHNNIIGKILASKQIPKQILHSSHGNMVQPSWF